jgi:hypothetical protein
MASHIIAEDRKGVNKDFTAKRRSGKPVLVGRVSARSNPNSQTAVFTKRCSSPLMMATSVGTKRDDEQSTIVQNEAFTNRSPALLNGSCLSQSILPHVLTQISAFLLPPHHIQLSIRPCIS